VRRAVGYISNQKTKSVYFILGPLPPLVTPLANTVCIFFIFRVWGGAMTQCWYETKSPWKLQSATFSTFWINKKRRPRPSLSYNLRLVPLNEQTMKKSWCWLTGDKNQQGRKFAETCRVRICICKESKKQSINDEKGGDKQIKQDS